MRNFFNTRVSRNSAFAMLLLWVLAMISGVANACLLEAPATIAHAVSTQHTHQRGATHISLSWHVPIKTGSNQADDAHTSKQACLKVCDDGSKSLTKKYSVELIEVGTRIIVAVLWSLSESIHLQHEQPNVSQHGAFMLPTRLMFSRLALNSATAVCAHAVEPCANFSTSTHFSLDLVAEQAGRLDAGRLCFQSFVFLIV